MTSIPRARDGIILGVLGLLCVGVVMVSSAGLTLDPEQTVTFRSILTSRSAIYMVLALGAMALASYLPLNRWSYPRAGDRWIPLGVPIALAALLLAVYLPGIGHEVNGSHRWIRLPGIGLTFQPSEIAKWGLIALVAWHGWRHAHHMPQFRRGLLYGLAIVAPVAVLVARADLGTGVLIMAASALVLLAGGVRLAHLLALAPVVLGAVALGVVTSPYRIRRLTTFADPYADPDGAGYHMIQSLVAIANGRITGRGLGFGLQKFGYLPEDRTDFLFAVIGEELGLAGVVLVLALIGVIVWCGATIVRAQTDRFRQLLGLGIIVTFGLQALMNLAVVTGLAPTKGIALPLLSSGGTGWILTAGALGLIVAMDRAADAVAAAHSTDGENERGDSRQVADDADHPSAAAA